MAYSKAKEAEAAAVRNATSPDPVRKELGAQTLPQELGIDGSQAHLPEETQEVIDQAKEILDRLPGRVVPEDRG